MTESKVAPIAVQLYSVRHYSDDLARQVAAVAEIGYTGVEILQTSLTAQEVQAILQEHGVRVVSAHVPYQALTDDLEKVIEFHNAIGNSWVIVPAPPAWARDATEGEPWRKLARSLADIGQRCLDEDLRVGYHNHRWEMQEFDGKRVIDWMMEEADPNYLFWEPDLAWVAAGGGDPEELLVRYAGRCPRVHVKDLAPAGENEDQKGVADVGYGTLDWDVLLPAARAAGAEWYIVEHDLPKDPIASVRRSLEFLHSKESLIL